MDAATHDQWLTDTRRFWDAGSLFEAKYRRICSSPQFDATVDEGILQELWTQETTQALDMILQDIPLRADWTCLEIGCGIGRLLRPLACRCRQVLGFDLSERMCRWAGQYLADVPSAEVRLNDGRSLPGVADASIDFVFSHLAFQHLTLGEVVEAYLAEIARVLKPGGFCRIQNWRDAPKPWREALKDLVRPCLGRGRYRSGRSWEWQEGREVKFGGVAFAPRTWRRLLRRHGLQPVTWQLGLGHEYWMWTTSRRRPCS